MPATASYLPRNHDRHPDYVPVPPIAQALPKQEPGVRRARALPYELRVDGTAIVGSTAFRLDFQNTGKAGVCFQVRSGKATEGPWSYTVESGKSLANTWPLLLALGQYDLSVYGPNGFLRQFRGTVGRDAKVDLDVDVRYDCDDDALILRIRNQSRSSARVGIASVYDRKSLFETIPRGRALEKRWSVKSTHGWYDLTITADRDARFLRRVAGHLENDRESVSDPALG